MAVNLAAPDPASLHAVPGVELGVAMAGIKKPGRKDLLIMRLAPGATGAGVFTQNRFCAAPVVLAKKHLKSAVRALVVNTGNAHAGSGQHGLSRAMPVCAARGHPLGCAPPQVLPFSTGVIMEPLPVERITAGLPKALLAKNRWVERGTGVSDTQQLGQAD